MRASILVLALFAAPAAAQEAVPIKWVLKEGDKFYAKNVTEMDMTMTLLGQTQDVKMKTTVVQRFKVIAAKQDATTVEMTILTMDISAGLPIPGLGDVGDRLAGVTITADLDSKMKMSKLKGYDKFIEKLAGDDENAKKQLGQMFSEATVGQMFSQIFSLGATAAKPVKVGESWQQTDKMAVGGFDASVDMKFKLDSVTSGIAKMGWTGDMKFKVGDTIPGLPPGVKLDKFDMKADKFGGTVKFDTKIGRLSEATQNAEMTGSMTMSANGQMIDVEMKIKLKQTATIDSKNPSKD